VIRERASFSRRLIDGGTMFVVTALSLLLLVYVGYGEGKRTYEQFHVDKLIAQGKIVQNSMENYLRAGLPLKHFVGFTTLAEPIVESEDVDALIVYDQAGRQVFLTIDKSKPTLPEPSPAIKLITDKIELDSDDGHYQVILPLRTRFETVGSIVVVSSTRMVDERMTASFRPLLYLVVGLSVAFALFVTITAQRLARMRAPWLQIAYGLTFLAMAGVLIGTLVSLYSDGIQGKAKGSASTLSQRLHDYVEFNLRIRDFDGLDRVFSDFQHLNTEVSEAALIIDGTIQIDTQQNKVGKPWLSDPHTYEYVVSLSKPDSPRQVKLAVAVPVDLVYREVERSVKNFAALFVASAFLAGLFLQVAASMQRLTLPRSGIDARMTAAIREETALNIVKPIFFLAVFLENLTYSFLPQFMQGVATTSGMSLGFAALPFTIYYLFFALTLIPSGYLSGRIGPKFLIWGGLLISAASMIGLTMPIGIVAVTAMRALAGIGQGALFIGIQVYILAVASPEKKTQGAAIIVFGFQGGMISGMAIGSLLVTHIHADGVFWISAAIGIAAALYSMLLIPRHVARPQGNAGVGATFRVFAQDMATVMRSADFLKTMLFIGVPAKAVLTGIITFALPLLLRRQGFQQEEIGQVIMLYGIGVVGASGYVSRLVDRTGKTDAILFWGSAISGLGLVLIGLTGMTVLGAAGSNVILMVAGVMIVGVAHGFINAPVVTHVAHSKLAEQIGVNSVTATYRFLERIGHVAGPFLIGQSFLIWGESASIVTWAGVMTATMGLLFIMRVSRPPVDAIGSEAAS
jgi:predicted MFS family arabinose efflux permease